MGRFNTYQSDLKYTPQTFEKLAMLPMQLRKEQDKAESDNDLMQLGIADTKVSAGYQDAYNSERSAFENRAKDLASRLAKEGAGNIELMNEFKTIKRQYNQSASATGVFGAGAKRFKEEAEAEKAYTEYGVKVGQGAERVAFKWREKMELENNAIKAGLAKNSRFTPEEMVHEYAPNKFDVGDFALKMKGIIGMTGGSTSDDLVAAMVKGPDGTMQINTDSHAWKTNKEQLMSFAALAKSQLYDETSDLRKHLDYNGKDIKNYLTDIGNLQGMMLTDQDDKSDSIKPFGGSNATGPTGPTEPIEDGLELEERNERAVQPDIKIEGLNGGVKTAVTARTAISLERRMEAMESGRHPSTLTHGYATQKQMVVDAANGVRQWEAKHKDRLDIEAKKKGYKSYLDIQNAAEVLKKQTEADFVVNRSSDLRTENGKRLYDQDLADRINTIEVNKDSLVEEIRNASGKIDGLYSKVSYGLGYTDKSMDVYKKTGDYLKTQSLFFSELGKESVVYDVDENGKHTPSEEQGSVNAAAATSMELSSIFSKNINGVPAVGITMTFGEGNEKSSKFVELEIGPDRKSPARGVVENMLKLTTNPETRFILQSVIDSANVNQIIPDSNKYSALKGSGYGASGRQSEMIVAFNRAAGGTGEGTIKPSGQYQIVSEGSHYSLNVKQKGDKSFRMYNIGDMIDDVSRRKDPVAGQNAKNAEVQAFVKLLHYNKIDGVKSFLGTSNPFVPEDNGSKRTSLSLAIEKYNDATADGLVITTEQRSIITNAFLEEVRHIGIKSMNKAAFLKH